MRIKFNLKNHRWHHEIGRSDMVRNIFKEWKHGNTSIKLPSLSEPIEQNGAGRSEIKKETLVEGLKVESSNEIIPARGL